MAIQSLTISPSAARSWIFGNRERAVGAKATAMAQRVDEHADEEDHFPPFDELSSKAKAQVLVEVAEQLQAGVPAVSHQMSVIHQRRLTSVEKALDAWLGRIAKALEPVASKGDAGLAKTTAALRAEKSEGLKIIDQLQCNIPAWGLTRGLQTFLRGCESL